MPGDSYLWGILARERVDTSVMSPVRLVQGILMPTIQAWAGDLLNSVEPSGSFAKGTANSSGTDIDLFISLSPATTETLQQIHATFFRALRNAGYAPRPQNVSYRIRVGSQDVDLVPAKRQNWLGGDHSLYRRKAGSWTKTNIYTHIALVSSAGRQAETRIIKLWRDQKKLDFPSFYLELAVIEALRGTSGLLADNVWAVFGYLATRFMTARFVDPANTNNAVSDDLTMAEKRAIAVAAARALKCPNWDQIVV